jgi:hypothetical protein
MRATRTGALHDRNLSVSQHDERVSQTEPALQWVGRAGRAHSGSFYVGVWAVRGAGKPAWVKLSGAFTARPPPAL